MYVWMNECVCVCVCVCYVQDDSKVSIYGENCLFIKERVLYVHIGYPTRRIISVLSSWDISQCVTEKKNVIIPYVRRL